MHHGTVTGAPVLAGLPTPLRTWATAHLRIAPVPPDTTPRLPSASAADSTGTGTATEAEPAKAKAAWSRAAGIS
jgi:hypothetical protein